MPTVLFERTFQAAHRLSRHEGKCSRIHGHNFRVAVEITTERLGGDGFVIEFDQVKELIDRFDHRLILNANDPMDFGIDADWVVLVPEDPTTEYMAQWFADAIADLVLEAHWREGSVQVAVELRETDSISARGAAAR